MTSSPHREHRFPTNAQLFAETPSSEYLVKNKYAAADKLTINGGSNGGANTGLSCVVFLTRFFFTDVPRIGLLVAACVNRAPPGTFGAAVAEVGVLDMLKVL